MKGVTGLEWQRSGCNSMLVGFVFHCVYWRLLCWRDAVSLNTHNNIHQSWSKCSLWGVQRPTYTSLPL